MSYEIGCRKGDSAKLIGVATVVSIVAGVVLLKETFTIFQIAGAVVIIAGVYTANVGKKGIA